MALIFNIVDKHEHLDDNIRVRVVSDIQPLAFGLCLYIWYNTAPHVVYITYIYSKHVSLVIKSLWKNCIDCVFEVE